MSSRTGLLAGCFSSIFGIVFVLCAVMIGPWALQYDLNHWMPFVKTGFTPLPMSIFMFIGGLFLFEVAVPVAILTWILFGLGLVG